MKKMRVQALLLATRPRTLTLSMVPVVVGTWLAMSSGVALNWVVFICTLVSALCIQIGTNYVNDALDFKKGADTAERLGPTRVTQSGLLSFQQVYSMGLLFFTAALLFGIPLILKGGWPIGVLLLISVVLGYCYTGGPFPIAYWGLSEFFVILFFGIATTAGAYYLQSGVVSFGACLAGLQLGLLATVFIAIANFRDYYQDLKAKKCTLVVRFGLTFGRYEIALMALLPFALSFFWAEAGHPSAAVLPWLSLPIALKLLRQVWNTDPGREYNGFLALTGQLHMVFGILLLLSFGI